MATALEDVDADGLSPGAESSPRTEWEITHLALHAAGHDAPPTGADALRAEFGEDEVPRLGLARLVLREEPIGVPLQEWQRERRTGPPHQRGPRRGRLPPEIEAEQPPIGEAQHLGRQVRHHVRSERDFRRREVPPVFVALPTAVATVFVSPMELVMSCNQAVTHYEKRFTTQGMVLTTFAAFIIGMNMLALSTMKIM